MLKEVTTAVGVVGIAILLTGCGSKEEAPKQIETIPVAVEKEADKGEESVEKGLSLASKGEEEKRLQQEKEAKAVKEFQQEMGRIDKIDFEKLSSDGLKKARSFPDTTRDLRKWIIRLHMYATIQNTTISDEELLKQARTSLYKRKGWFDYVQSEYKVSIKKDEVDAYIKKVASENDNTKAIAKGLEMSVKEMNYEYDRDQYELQVYWQKVLPQLEKKYPAKDGESLNDYNNRLNQAFENDLKKWMQAKKEG